MVSFRHLKAAVKLIDQLIKPRQNNTGEDPWRNPSFRYPKLRHGKNFRERTPSCVGENGPDATPSIPRFADQEIGRASCRERVGAREGPAARAKRRAARARRSRRGEEADDM